MENMVSPQQTYLQNISLFKQQVATLKASRSRMGWLRLLVVIAFIAIVCVAKNYPLPLEILFVLIGITIFIRLVLADNKLKEKLLNAERLLTINQSELKIADYNYFNEEDGKIFEPAHHAYAQDLDIFGKASLYQFINRCTAEQSKKLLSQQLLFPQTKQSILQKQEAAKELSLKVEWRQQLQSFGIQKPIAIKTEVRINNWLKEKEIFSNPYWHLLLFIYPIITISIILLYAYDVITLANFNTALFLFIVISGFFTKKIHPVWKTVSNIAPEIATMYNQLNHLEKERFNSALFNQLQKNITTEGLKASKEILQLKNILDRFDLRLNVFAFFILNTFLLWDLWQLLALNKWKKLNTTFIPFWFDAIAEAEVISTIATLAFNHPEWCWPVIVDEHFTFNGKAIGHPLIRSEKCVANSFTLNGIGKTALITGSNMGGKSTFLRSIGVNMILAYIGAPVCAESFSLSIVQLMSSMRVADNLAESTSTFYAELKKLEGIISSVNRHEKTFILLDEILRGTNSLDRHTGSKALVQQFIKQGAVAVLATHDVELAKLQEGYPNNIANYHFDVQVSNGELYFDYKLKDGICQSLNASILMRKIGIEL